MITVTTEARGRRGRMLRVKKAQVEYQAIEKKISGLMKSEESVRTSLRVVSFVAEEASTTDQSLFRKAQ